MAIGIGRMFGFEFKANFNLPYKARSIREFWQKWHISLSSWFRDYVYIPLGGNRKGKWRTGINLISIFVLCGFWHGANFTFLAWGLMHGLFISLERFIPKNKKVSHLRKLTGHVYVWLVLLVTWVFFRADTIQGAIDYLHTMVSFTNYGTMNPDFQSFISPYYSIVLTLGFFISIGVFSRLTRYMLRHHHIGFVRFRMIETCFLLLIFYLSFIQLMSNDFNPFIYYRF
jgi:alginate O-acetyltransferase complex protein AlgI